MSYNYIDSLSIEDRKRYDAKLAAIGLRECPFRLPADAWVDEPTQWPDVQFPDLVMYLISSAGKFFIFFFFQSESKFYFVYASVIILVYKL